MGWITDEENPKHDATTERAETEEQKKKLKGNEPDYVLYKSETHTPIAIIETEKKRIKHINNIIFKELTGLYGTEDKTIFKKKLLIKNPKTLTGIINKLSKTDLLNAESDVAESSMIEIDDKNKWKNIIQNASLHKENSI